MFYQSVCFYYVSGSFLFCNLGVDVQIFSIPQRWVHLCKVLRDTADDSNFDDESNEAGVDGRPGWRVPRPEFESNNPPPQLPLPPERFVILVLVPPNSPLPVRSSMQASGTGSQRCDYKVRCWLHHSSSFCFCVLILLYLLLFLQGFRAEAHRHKGDEFSI